MIGILGGAFDPVHYGHLRPAVEVHAALGLQGLAFIPTGHPPHRPPARASGVDRQAMLELAMADCPDWWVDDRELRRSGPSYMVETLTEVRAERGAEEPLALVLGMDAFLGLTGWHQWSRLFDLAHLVVCTRPGPEAPWPPALAAAVAQRRVAEPSPLHTAAAGRVYFHRVTQMEIASTAIRELLASGGDPRFLLPDAVLHYIRSKGLYHNQTSTHAD